MRKTVVSAVLSAVLLSSAHAAPVSARAPTPPPVWMTYQNGTKLQLAIDRASFRWVDGGLLQFRHRETFADQKTEPTLKVHYFVRTNTVVVDCANDRYALVSSDYLDRNGKLVWATTFPLPPHLWRFQAVEEGSMGASMLDIACQTVRHPAYKTE